MRFFFGKSTKKKYAQSEDQNAQIFSHDTPQRIAGKLYLFHAPELIKHPKVKEHAQKIYEHLNRKHENLNDAQELLQRKMKTNTDLLRYMKKYTVSNEAKLSEYQSIIINDPEVKAALHANRYRTIKEMKDHAQLLMEQYAKGQQFKRAVAKNLQLVEKMI